KRVFLVILFTSFSGSLVSRIPGAVHSVMMPASGNENDLNMPSGTIEIFVRCYVEVERIMSAMDRTT
ncbi:hypothetical protein QU846_22880, partial [Escherichia coli]|nr:hypothetical protein [Escherichia coli]MDM8858398.1 hypothetical protein [Escherichia coli]MDM8863404.1 hypothetical protein [Escherichia coli]MDM8863411.1 hypothetical protein [Escherichia coli]MDM8868349.1 hypothetical protein [Escherichia coli]